MSEQLARLKAEQRAGERRKNRELMPGLAALMDEVREQFPDAKMIWGEDLMTGVTVGVKPDEKHVFTIPKDYFPSQQIDITRKPGKGKR